ncbi:MAG: hypothetical protein V4668_01520 [Patescibacteria group bacterium]
MTLKKQLLNIVPLVLLLCGLFAYNFMDAQWSGPAATPPEQNATAPINIGGIYQAKLGDLGAIRMRAGAYCDESGTVCFNVNDITNLATSTVDYVQYAKNHCGFNVPNPGSVSLHGVKLDTGAFYDLYDRNGAISILEWVCKGPNSVVNYEIQDACGLSVSNPGSVSLHSVRLKNGTTYDIFDSNGGTAVLNWRCDSRAPLHIRNIETACGLNVPNPGSVSLHGVLDSMGNFFDFWDANNATARLRWSCV